MNVVTKTSFDLAFTSEVEQRTSSLYEKVKKVIPELEWAFFAPHIDAINRLKEEKNAVILAHNYMTPEIFHCVADIRGDSLALAHHAVDTEADIIVMAGVHFMAETAKLLNPDKKVLIPDLTAGCSLAESITGEDVRLMREKYPGVPVVSYVNTSAQVKAESDICCTSGNALEIINGLGVDKVIMLPDEFLAQNIARETDVDVVTWKGRCVVHEQFSVEDIRGFRESHPGVIVLAHPECSPEVIDEADFSGSTAGMTQYVGDNRPSRVVLVTECSMSDNVSADYPDVEFVKPCNLCPHMKKIDLPKILQSLQEEIHEVTIEADAAQRAQLSVTRMLEGWTPS